MNEDSRKIVNLALVRMASGEIEKEIRFRRIKKITIVSISLIAIVLAGYFWKPTVLVPVLNAQEPKSNHVVGGGIEVVLEQDRFGHYIFIGEINNKRVKFLLDTGATMISVPTLVAKYLKMPFGKTYYSETANGKALSYRSVVNNVKVGDISLFNVDASIAAGMEGDEILLGMSFLKNLTIKQENGKMILIQNN
jgi:aspartyl protease family protein